MEIKVNSISAPVVQKKGSRTWSTVEINYTTSKGQTMNRKIPSFDDSYQEVIKMETGGSYDVKTVKDGDYWKWAAVTKLEGGSAPSGNKASGASAYVPDAVRQTLIIRQSSFSSAVAFIGHTKKTASLEETLAIARRIEAYVTGTTVASDSEDVRESGALNDNDGEGEIN